MYIFCDRLKAEILSCVYVGISREKKNIPAMIFIVVKLSRISLFVRKTDDDYALHHKDVILILSKNYILFFPRIMIVFFTASNVICISRSV